MLDLSITDPDRLVTVAHALSTKARVNMLELLGTRSLNVVEIAEALQLPVSTVAHNVKVLEAAGLIRTELLPASRGAMKLCTRNWDDIHIALRNGAKPVGGQQATYEIEMPVGHYSDCEVTPTCGMASGEGMLVQEDEPSSFYHPKHVRAQLIWLRDGFLEYLLPLALPPEARIQAVEVSMELCSEAPSYDHNWPSDITLWINGQEVGTWTSPGDFGDRRGRLSPEWWSDWATQYGQLKQWRVDEQQATLDGERLSPVTVDDLQLSSRPSLRLRVGVKPEAVHKGGLNLFGRQFGDHEQEILLKVHYALDPK
ncbi:ArsR/SmtB family transcription factor [Paenibacillus daejeonensis]|uniref:ArsR/SmtB family transcription factor n=1 Tax=Paenibacillus daejeonensis TaxID=135193 RepID=UPI0003708548|nr:helix-turn-helix domain-containing protein [Paenibacillus daejeonensis]